MESSSSIGDEMTSSTDAISSSTLANRSNIFVSSIESMCCYIFLNSLKIEKQLYFGRRDALLIGCCDSEFLLVVGGDFLPMKTGNHVLLDFMGML